MKTPKFELILSGITQTLIRFPLSIACSIVSTAALLLIVDHDGLPQPTVLFPILFAGVVGIALFTAIALSVQFRGWGTPGQVGATAAGVIVLALYAWMVPVTMFQAPELHVNRFQMLLIGVHLLLASIPFVRRRDITGEPLFLQFWEFNIQLAGRVVLGMLGSFALWGGLALALAAINNLFGLHIASKRYFELWIVVVGLFNTTFILTGVPLRRVTPEGELQPIQQPDPKPENKTEGMHYPKPLRMFAFYVAAPLVTVYAVILYAYIIKMLVTWCWLDGWVAPLVMGFSMAGVMAVLIIEPLRRVSPNGWINRFSTGFVISMLPAAILLILAVNKRVSEYGFTEMRVVGMLVGVWILLMSAYALLGKRRNMILIPLTLAIPALLLTVGPWSIFSIAEHSQTGRLHALLERNAMINGGKVNRPHQSLDKSSVTQIDNVLEYLGRVHGYDGIQPWFDSTLTAGTNGRKTPRSATEIVTLMGLNLPVEEGKLFRYVLDSACPIPIAGFESMTPEIKTSGRGDGPIEGSNADLRWHISNDLETIQLAFPGEADTMTVSMLELLANIPHNTRSAPRRDREKMDAKVMMSDVEGKWGKFRFFFYEMDAKWAVPSKRSTSIAEGLIPTEFSMCILYSAKKSQ